MTRLRLALLAGVALAPLSVCVSSAFAQSAVTLPPVDVVAAPPAPVSAEGAVSEADLSGQRAATPDAARLFTPIPGVAFQTGGGVSALPVVRGMADDRNRILVGGVDLASACANHMNPALSYISAPQVGSAEVASGAVSVSKGGDSSGSTIIVRPAAPIFAQAARAAAPVVAKDGGKGKLPTVKSGPADDGGALVFAGSLSSFFRSADKGVTVSGSATAATRHFSLSYAGTWARGSNYRAGGGGDVRSTKFQSENHAATLAYQNDGHTITARATAQRIPYQGFVNQRMDMLGNDARGVSLAYEGRFGWGKLEADASFHHTKHYMNFMADKGGSTRTTGMPMYTDGKDFGANLKAEIALSQRDTLRVGANFHSQRLDDWWPPVAGMAPTMCCNTFWNIRDGRRDRFGVFAEWAAKWSPAWSSEVGARVEHVRMTTGPVQGYSNVDVGRTMMGHRPVVNYLSDSLAFNAADRSKSDLNVDLTAKARYEPSKGASFEFGVARKVRSPNLYERFAWSKGSPNFPMSPSMVNWSGDANGYVGNLNLKPEAAHTVSATMILRDPVADRWEVKLSPYASYVTNYIDADRLWRQSMASGMRTPFYTLQFANHDARLYGVDGSARARVVESASWGALTLSGSFAYVNGKNLDTGDRLYNIMPLRGRLGLEHKIRLAGGDFTSAIEIEGTQNKTRVNVARGELRTPGYALVNARASYEWRTLRFDAGVENAFDRRYYLPLGGVNYADYKATNRLAPVLGMGRSFFAGVTAKF